MLFKSTLEKEGFILNKYDQCVANKVIDGQQCTIAWYVDDNKLSHVNPRVVNYVLGFFKKHFGELTVTRGQKHKLLGINIHIRKERKIELDMTDHLKDAIRAFGEPIEGSAATTALSNLFRVNEDSPRLEDWRSDIFHTVTAKVLHTVKRARPYLETLWSFLTTRVSKSTEEDWKKLRRGLLFINGTMDDKRIIGANLLENLFTYIDSAYGVHNNMRGHTGGSISMGYGLVHGK